MGANTGSSTTPIGSRNSAPRSGADPAASVRRECGKLRRADRYRVHVIAKHLCGATVTRGTEHAALHFVSPTASVDADLHGSSCNLVDRTGYRRSDAQIVSALDTTSFDGSNSHREGLPIMVWIRHTVAIGS